MARRSITFPSQCRELTLVRQDDQVWAGAHRSLAVATLKRVDLALQAFFRRVKAGVSGGGKVGHVGGLIVGLRRTSTTQWYVLPPPLTRPAAARLPGVVAGLEYAAPTRSATW